MKNLGIKTRVIFLGTIPALLFAIILVGYAITNIFSVLDQSLEDRGKVIASQLAPAAEYGVISGNGQVLQRLVQQVLSNEPDLTTVMVVDVHGLTLAVSGRELPKVLTAKIAKEELAKISHEKGMIFTFPIYRSLVEIDDFSNLSSKELEVKKSYIPEKIGHVYV